MKKLIPFSMILVSVFLVTGCSFMGKAMKQPNYRVDFAKDDFEWSTQVTGEATQVKILNIDWARLFKKTGGAIDGNDGIMALPVSFTIPVIGFPNGRNSACEMYALYEMMSANPGYDVVLYPSYETTATGFPYIFVKTTVKATARLGKLK